MHTVVAKGDLSRSCAFSGLCQGQNHRWPLHLNLGKPSKNHRFQWLICKKTFNGDGSGMVKPLKKPSMAMVPWKKTLPSHRYKKMTIVEVYIITLNRYKYLTEISRLQRNVTLVQLV